MVINDLFFIFFREKSDSFRTVTYQKYPKTVYKTPENRAFQACFQIASSRLLKPYSMNKWLKLSHLFAFNKVSVVGRSDRYRTVSFDLILRRITKKAHIK